jgi:hypothetical protein
MCVNRWEDRIVTIMPFAVRIVPATAEHFHASVHATPITHIGTIVRTFSPTVSCLVADCLATVSFRKNRGTGCRCVANEARRTYVASARCLGHTSMCVNCREDRTVTIMLVVVIPVLATAEHFLASVHATPRTHAGTIIRTSLIPTVSVIIICLTAIRVTFHHAGAAITRDIIRFCAVASGTNVVDIPSRIRIRVTANSVTRRRIRRLATA